MTFCQVCDWVAIKNLFSILSTNDILSGLRLGCNSLNKLFSALSNDILSGLSMLFSHKNIACILSSDILSGLGLGCNSR